jgi:hypothetical protein
VVIRWQTAKQGAAAPAKTNTSKSGHLTKKIQPPDPEIEQVYGCSTLLAQKQPFAITIQEEE